MSTRLSDQSYRRELGDGLVLRWSTAADIEPLTALYSYVFRQKADSPPNDLLAGWTRELGSDKHPLITSGDFALVEDTVNQRIVAATCLLSQTWDYAGVAFPVGRPEIVASLPEYRNRGLVRAVFELIHARSDGRGDLAQGITGIPYYYRQFGYEFALPLGGSKFVIFPMVPKLEEGKTEPYTLRPATDDDLPLLAAMYERECARRDLLVTARVSDAFWHFNQHRNHRSSAEGWLNRVLIDAEGQPVGAVLLNPRSWGDTVPVRGFMLNEGVSLLAALPSLLRALIASGDALVRKPNDPPLGKIQFNLGDEHRLYDALGSLAPASDPAYCWYVRVPDLPLFIQKIAPVLEQRLAESFAAGHTGELRLNFYRGGLRLVLEHGRLATAEPWRADHNWGPGPQAGFPPLVFLQLLFGHRSLAELRSFLPDAWAEDDAAKLLNILFPKTVSWVLPLE